ncbi:MAG: twin-arginine translocase TatA/TatE family subunit [Planctomycetota bacterium]
MFGLSPIQLLICGGVAVLLFGGRLPSVARSLGKSLTELRRGMQDMQHEFRDAMREVDDAAQTVTDVTRGRLPNSNAATVAHDSSVRDDGAPDHAYDTYDEADTDSDVTEEAADESTEERKGQSRPETASTEG